MNHRETKTVGRKRWVSGPRQRHILHSGVLNQKKPVGGAAIRPFASLEHVPMRYLRCSPEIVDIEFH
jgi:hypothetical protein